MRSEQSSELTSHQPHSLSLGTWRAGSRATIRRMNVVTFALNSSCYRVRGDTLLRTVGVHHAAVEGDSLPAPVSRKLGSRNMYSFTCISSEALVCPVFTS